MDYRAALIDFYQKHNPDKLREIDLLLAKYRGREEELLHALKVKYGVHKTTPPTQPPPQTPSQPQPPPRDYQEEQEPPRKEEEKKAEQFGASREEIKPEREHVQERHEGPLSSSTDKGRSAAERAEYWKKELEKRERERSGGLKPGSSKYSLKNKKEEYEPEVEGEEEENSNGSSWFSAKRIVLLLLALLLIGGVAVVLLNENMRTQVGSLIGLSNTEEPRKEGKKAGIEPDVVAQTQDSAKVKSSEDFALDEEEDSEGENLSITDNPVNTGKTQVENKDQYEPETKRVDDPPKDNKVQGGLQRNYWYLSYISVSQETVAKKAVRELQSQGYDNAGYYYIPEYDTRGKRLYKVYIGPYSTVEAAERALDDNLRKISPGTYPYLLK